MSRHGRRRYPNDPKDPRSYRFDKVPHPIRLECDLTPAEEKVWYVIFGPISRYYAEVSGKASEVADEAGLSVKHTRRCMASLIAKGLLERTTDKAYSKLRPVFPQWLIDVSERYLVEQKTDIMSRNEAQIPVEDDRKRDILSQKRDIMSQNGNRYVLYTRSIDHMSEQSSDVGVEKRDDDQIYDAGEGGYDPIGPPEDVEETVPSGSRRSGPKIGKVERQARSGTRTTSSPRTGGGSRYSGEIFRYTPSKRRELDPELARRSGSPYRLGWTVLAEWAQQHLRRVRGEASDLFVKDGRELGIKAKNIVRWFERWGDELEVSEPAALVGRILDAERLGYKLALMYYFTPSKRGPLFDLLAGKSRRELTPSQINDIGARSPAHSDPEIARAANEKMRRYAEELREKRRRRQEAEAARPKDEPEDDGPAWYQYGGIGAEEYRRRLRRKEMGR